MEALNLRLISVLKVPSWSGGHAARAAHIRSQSRKTIIQTRRIMKTRSKRNLQ